jgi:hypothetical protein
MTFGAFERTQSQQMEQTVQLNRPGFWETYSVLSRDHVAPRTVDLFRVGWRDVSDTSKQAPVIEPIDPAEFRHH